MRCDGSQTLTLSSGVRGGVGFPTASPSITHSLTNPYGKFLLEAFLVKSHSFTRTNCCREQAKVTK